MKSIKSYTDIEQSKKLAEILPLESADMCYVNDGTAIKIDANSYSVRYSMWKDCVVAIIPCWSLAALLSVLPLPRLIQDKADDELFWQCSAYDEDGILLCEIYDNNAINACYEMILKLNELKML